MKWRCVQGPDACRQGGEGTHVPAAAAAKLHQSCLTLCDPTDSSPSGSTIPGILQARALEWAAISFSNSWKWKVKVKLLSCARLVMTPWTAAHQAPPSMGFSRQEYWSGVPLPSPTHVPRAQNKLIYLLKEFEQKGNMGNDLIGFAFGETWKIVIARSRARLKSSGKSWGMQHLVGEYNAGILGRSTLMGRYRAKGLPTWLSGKGSARRCRRCGFSPWAGKIPWRRKWKPTPVFLPG